jgi:hypothetical protein
MNISIMSYFRDSKSYIERYCNQMNELQILLSKDGHSLRLVLGYGDSIDGSDEALFESALNGFDCAMIDVSHGGKYHGSVVDAERFRQLSFICNRLWRQHRLDSDIIGHVESDLIWSAHSIVSLLNAVEVGRSPVIVAPMVLHQSGVFYDTWAFRRGLRNFQQHKPYHPALLEDGRYLEMDSVGSLFFTQYAFAKDLTYPEGDVVVGFCKQAEARGACIYLDKQTKVYHP